MYVVRIVGPAGWERYLSHGREVELQSAATPYAHPSNAWQAAEAYQQKKRGLYVDVIDANDPENTVPQE